MDLASRNVSGLDESTSTTKPSIPSDRISHMKSKRRWPGVPNRYSTRSSPTVIRPKSMATVVCSLTFSASDEIDRSVDTTSISEIAPTNAVLPELKARVAGHDFPTDSLRQLERERRLARGCRSYDCEHSTAAETALELRD